MKVQQLDDMIRGWFVGNFQPTVLDTPNFEVGVKRYKKGESESRHHHRKAIEITLILEGKVKMNDQIFSKGAIITFGKFESTDFEALEDTVTVVVRDGSHKGDKYPGDYNG